MVEMKGKFLKLSFIAFPCKMSIDFAIELIHRAAAFTHVVFSPTQGVRFHS